MFEKFANPMIQPQLPAPAVTGLPKPPQQFQPQKNIAPMPRPHPLQTQQAGGGWDLGNFKIPGTSSTVGEMGESLFKPMGLKPPEGGWNAANLTENTPPLMGLTKELPESMQGAANSALGFVQKGLKHVGPQGFAGLMGGLAPGLTKGLLSTPVGLPAMVGLHGLLRGGQSFGAAKTFFNPLLGRLGIGGK